MLADACAIAPTDYANSSTTGAKSPPTGFTQALSRPVFYRALEKDGGGSYAINEGGCVTLPKQKLTACFDDRGVHFNNAGSPLTLHLVACGGGGLGWPPLLALLGLLAGMGMKRRRS